MSTEPPTPIALLNMRLLAKTLPRSGKDSYRPLTRAQIKALRIGEKVLMWDALGHTLHVQIESRIGQRKFVGRVVRSPIDPHSAVVGKLIAFDGCNIVYTWK